MTVVAYHILYSSYAGNLGISLKLALREYIRKSVVAILSLVPRYKGSSIAQFVETSNAESPTPV